MDILSTKFKTDIFLKFYAPLLLPIVNSEKDIHNLEVPNFQKILKFREFKDDFQQGRSIHTGIFCTSDFKCPYKNKAISGIRYMSLLDTITIYVSSAKHGIRPNPTIHFKTKFL